MLTEDNRHLERQPIVFKRRQDKILKIKGETKEVETEIHPGKGVLKKRSFQTPGNTLSGGSVANLGISEGKMTRRKKK